MSVRQVCPGEHRGPESRMIGGVGTALRLGNDGIVLPIMEPNIKCADDSVRTARIAPPTSQILPSMEAGLADIASAALKHDEIIRARGERSIRNHDPCMA